MNEIIEKLQREKLTDYQPVPFWSWNAKLDPEELIRQIRWMKECGIGGFFMHARTGLKTEYLSKEWMNCVDICAEEAAKLEMNAWIYDENGWPSGSAGGKLLAERNNRNQYLIAETGDFDPTAAVSYRLEKERLVRVYEKTEDGSYLNLHIRVAASTTDILNPEVVDQFLSLTHEKYQEHYGMTFSEKVKGFFTDEPQYYGGHTPYTKMMEAYFQEQYQEDILDSLGLLFVEREGYRSFRYRYWKGMQSLLLKNFAGKVYEWCEAHGVRLTGHYVEEQTLGGQIRWCGGVMPFYEYEHIPGIDWLGRASDNELSPRQVGSVAAQLGKKQVLTETFAFCGWDISPFELRRIAGFQYVNGVNLMCQHLIPYAEYGTRKHDYPAHYSPVNPWVQEEFGTFNTYFTRLGYLLAEGEQKVRTAMLHPIRSAYLEYKREAEKEGYGIALLEQQLKGACRTLSRLNIAYHFLDETLLEKYGFVREGAIGCGACSYDYLVIPPLMTMDRSTERLLREYAAQGGRILLLGDAPPYLEGEPYDYPYLKSNCTLEEIEAAQPYHVSNPDTEIYSALYTLDGTSYLYAVNASRTEAYRQTFRMGGEIRSFQELDLNSLRVKRVPLTVTLKPGDCVLLFPDRGEGREGDKALEPFSMAFQDAAVSFEENYLPLDYVRYSLDGIHYSKKWPCAALFQRLLEQRAEGTIYFKYEFEVREKPEKICIRAEAGDGAIYYVNGVPLSQPMACPIEKNVLAYDIAPFVRSGVNEFTAKVWWHESPAVYDALFGGTGTVARKNSIAYDSELEPAYVAGHFGVYPAAEYRELEEEGCVGADMFYIGRAPQKVCDPVTDGLPFVRGAVTLRQTVILPSRNVLLKVEGSYHAATVYINGKKAGKLFWEKEIDISAYAEVGENEVAIRFLIGNQNLLGPQHFTGRLDDGASLWSFELNGAWEEDRCECYHDWYRLKQLFALPQREDRAMLRNQETYKIEEGI